MLRRRFKSRREGRKPATIDMTSLIDLTFLLLVTFIITMPALEQGVHVILPKAKADKLPDREKKTLTVTVDAEGNIFAGREKVTRDELEVRLGDLKKLDAEASVLVRGDENQKYEKIMEVVKMVHRAGIRRMALVTLGE